MFDTEQQEPLPMPQTDSLLPNMSSFPLSSFVGKESLAASSGPPSSDSFGGQGYDPTIMELIISSFPQLVGQGIGALPSFASIHPFSKYQMCHLSDHLHLPYPLHL